MAKVEREDLGNLSAILTVTLEKSDYEKKVEEELNRLRNKVQLKGFRKGKTPLSAVKKLYGPEVINEIVGRLLSEEMSKHMEEEKFSILADPIFAEGYEAPKISITSPQDYVYKFEIGKAPEINLGSLSESEAVEWNDVEVPEHMIKDAMDRLVKFASERVSAEDEVKEEDMIQVKAVELDGDTPKEGGIETGFSLYYDYLTDETKEILKGKKKGDSFRGNIFELEKDRKKEDVRKYMLKLEENDEREVNEMFELTIDDIKRMQPPEKLEQEHFDRYFGEDKVHSEEEAKKFFKNDLKKYLDEQANSIFFTEALDNVFDKTVVELPQEFLKKWFEQNRRPAEGATMEEAFKSFLEATKNSLVLQEIGKKFDVQVKAEDVIDSIKEEMRPYYRGQLDEESLTAVAKNIVESDKYRDKVRDVSEKVHSQKIKEAILEHAPKKPVKISFEEFEKKVKAFNEKFKEEEKATALVLSEEEE